MKKLVALLLVLLLTFACSVFAVAEEPAETTTVTSSGSTTETTAETVTEAAAEAAPKPSAGLPDDSGELAVVAPFSKTFRVAIGGEAESETEHMIEDLAEDGTSSAKAGISGVLELTFGFSASYYQSGDVDFTSLNLSLDVSVRAEFMLGLSRKIPLGVGACLDNGAGVEFHIGPYLYGEITGTFSVGMLCHMNFSLKSGWTASKPQHRSVP